MIIKQLPATYKLILICLASAYLAVLPMLVSAQNAVVADPEHYTVEYENDEVRIIRARYGPGEHSPMHEYRAGVGVDFTDGHFRVTLADGTELINKSEAGDVNWFEAGRHSADNLNDTPYEAVYIEIKD